MFCNDYTLYQVYVSKELNDSHIITVTIISNTCYHRNLIPDYV